MIYHRASKVVHHYLFGSIYIVFYQFPSNSCNYQSHMLHGAGISIRLHQSANFRRFSLLYMEHFSGTLHVLRPHQAHRHGDARGTDLARRSRAAGVRGDFGVEAPETAPEAVPPVSPASSSPRMARFSSWQK